MEKFVYYPITPYHIILSFMLCEYHKNHHNSIILDNSIFTAGFINKVSENSNWNNIYILKKYPGVRNYIYKFILYKLKYNEIFQLRHINLVFFSFGDGFTNLLINSIYENNNILMCEDGLLPYYGLDIIRKYYSRLLHEPKIKKLKRSVQHIVNSKSQFDSQQINKFLILNPEWLPPEIIQQYEVEQVKLDQKIIQNVFDKLTHIYDYKNNNIFNNIDIIFFDSDIVRIGTSTKQEEFDFLCNVFKQLQGVKIFVKLKPFRNNIINNKRIEFYNAIQKKTSCNMVIDCSESKYPWEIVFYNNAVALKGVSFMCIGFSTAFLTSKKFFNLENDIICLKKLFATEKMQGDIDASIKDLIERIKRTYLYKNIYIPKNFDEIKDIKELLRPT